jgi:hypothetical protein
MRARVSQVCEENPDVAAIADPEVVRSSMHIGVVSRPCCFLCGNIGAELCTNGVDWLFGALGSWRFRHCVSCGVLWLDPQPRKTF